MDSINSFFDFKKQYVENCVVLKQAQRQLDHFNALALKENVMISITHKSPKFVLIKFVLFKIIYLEYPDDSHEKEINDERLEVEKDDLLLKSEHLESTIELTLLNNKLKSHKTVKLKDPPNILEENEISDGSADESSEKDEENEEKSTIKKRTHKLKNERSRSQCQVCGKMYAELSRYEYFVNYFDN